MESEIIYTEVKFKNAPPPATATAPPAKSTSPSAPQKHTHSLLWLGSALLLLLLLCLSLLAALIVTLLNPSCEKHRTLSQSSTEWHCVTGRAEGKGRICMCCPVGWDSFQDSCYYVFNDTMTWGHSERNCTGMGSHLVVINTEAEQDFISDWIRRTATGSDKKDYYIGLTSQEMKGQWHWVDKTLYNKITQFWISGEPNYLDREKCAVLNVQENKSPQNNRNWNNIECSLLKHRICESAVINSK